MEWKETVTAQDESITMTDTRKVESAADNPPTKSKGDFWLTNGTCYQSALQKRRGDPMNLDRATLSSTQLYQLAIREEMPLSQDEKDRVSPDYLFVLAITNKLVLTQHDKARLGSLHLAHLAVTEKIDLSEEDKDRLPKDMLFDLFTSGFVGLSKSEAARFTAAQLEQLKALENANSESLAGT